MKVYIIVGFLLVAAIATMAAPAIEEYQPHHETGHVESVVREKRATCDLLSAFGVADTACAAHCLTLGKAGGTCQNGICVCRRDTFSDVWDKRFGTTESDE